MYRNRHSLLHSLSYQDKSRRDSVCFPAWPWTALNQSLWNTDKINNVSQMKMSLARKFKSHKI